jgi:bifunctional enzyme CysN/CysC
MTALAQVCDPAAARPARADAHHDLPDRLRVLACGSVDDGKSTLIGRLLWDAQALLADQREALSKGARTAAGTPDFSLLVDGLLAEREQGITIDVAWRYVDTRARRLVILDSPGHEQYTRNMATGASHADLAILLVDARTGIAAQTRRHAAILDLMGVGSLVLAVNKMDLVDWSEARFRDIQGEFSALTARFDFRDAVSIPVSAVHGDNIARRSPSMPWYSGPVLLDHLQQVPVRDETSAGDFRFPVQMVIRDGGDFRGLAGTVASGSIAAGGAVIDIASRRRARVSRIVTMDRDIAAAEAGRAVVLELDADIDVSRGAVLAAPGHEPRPAKDLDTRLVWLSDAPLVPDRGYLLRTATDLVPVVSLEVVAHFDPESLSERPARACSANDIAVARIGLARSVVAEPYAQHRETGSFLLVDAVTGASVAAGIVAAAHTRERIAGAHSFRLTRSLLRKGVAADLGHDAASEQELRRRADEVAILLRGAGVAVEIEDPWLQNDPAGVRSLWLTVLTVLSFGFVSAVILGLV